MNDLSLTTARGSNGTRLTMSSREIAELVKSRHDDVKRSIERLAERGVIVQPPMADEQSIDAMGRTRSTQVYVFSGEQGKRDSYVVVGQLCPKFLAAIVDRWQELENRSTPVDINIALNDPSFLRGLLGNYAERVEQLEGQVEQMKPSLAKLERIEESVGSMCLRDAAKVLKIQPLKLNAFMSGRQWIYKRPGNSNWVAYQAKIQAGYLEHREHTYRDSLDQERVISQVMVTGKGLVKLAELLNQPLQ